MSAIQFEFKLHFISVIDPAAAGIWAAITNDVKAVLGEKKKKKDEMMDFYLYIYSF